MTTKRTKGRIVWSKSDLDTAYEMWRRGETDTEIARAVKRQATPIQVQSLRVRKGWVKRKTKEVVSDVILFEQPLQGAEHFIQELRKVMARDGIATLEIRPDSVRYYQMKEIKL